MPKKKVYISSTYKDLIPYRNAIRNMFLYKGLQEEYTLVSMEGYVAENKTRAISVCLDDVREADIYILILAKRYGSIVAGTGKSYTEMEYDEAVKVANKNNHYKIFVFYSSSENEKDDFKETIGLETPALESFYKSVLEKNACFTSPFTNPDNLCKQILLTFNYNFKKLDNKSDYREALLLINRVKSSYSFSRQKCLGVNSFTFKSLYDNNPNDFIERISDLEMGGEYNKCKIGLSQFTSTEVEKFNHTLLAYLSSQWAIDMKALDSNYNEKLFLSIEINSEQIKSDHKLECLHKVLIDFLPKYLSPGGQISTDRILFIFYNFILPEDSNIKKFDDFIEKLANALKIENCLTNMDQLGDVHKLDTEYWLKTYVKGHIWGQDEIDELLEIEDTPFIEKFKMKKVKKLILKWLKENLFKN